MDSPEEFYSYDEVIMLRFLGICQPSLDPDRYEAVLDACRYLCGSRMGLDDGSLDKCLRHLDISGFDLSEILNG